MNNCHPRIRSILSIWLLLAVFCVSCDMPSSRQAPVERDGKLTIGFVGRTDDDFWRGVEYGANHAAAGNDLHLLRSETRRSDDAGSQKKAITDLISQRVKGVIVSPGNRFELQSTIKNALDCGIFVVLLNTEPPMFSETDNSQLAVVTTDQFAAGRLAAEKTAALLEEKGRVAVIRHNAMSQATEDREEGFLSQIREYPEIELVFEDLYVGTRPEVVREKLRTFLQLYCPDGDVNVDGVFVSHEATACELLDLMSLANLDKKAAFVAFGSDSRLVTGMLTLRVDALVVEQPVQMGELAVETMARLLRRETVDSKIDCGVYLVTIDNFMSPYAQALLNPVSSEDMEILLAGPPEDRPDPADGAD